MRKGNEAIVCLLLENGADINARSASKQTSFQRAMIERGSGSVFQVLLKRGRNLQHNEPWEQTALHVAAEEGHERVVRLLLEKGANPDTRDSGDETPLDLSGKFGFMPVVKVLEPVTHQESRGLFPSLRDATISVNRLARSALAFVEVFCISISNEYPTEIGIVMSHTPSLTYTRRDLKYCGCVLDHC